uniref:hypothetical protein n=1 Tax=Ruegeria lacuscaerulensis TaxID=55218 RepID=UPI001BE442FA
MAASAKGGKVPQKAGNGQSRESAPAANVSKAGCSAALRASVELHLWVAPALQEFIGDFCGR